MEKLRKEMEGLEFLRRDKDRWLAWKYRRDMLRLGSSPDETYILCGLAAMGIVMLMGTVLA